MSDRQDILMQVKGKKISKATEFKKVSSYFGENTFCISEIKKRIDKDTFTEFMLWIDEGKKIGAKCAETIAEAMKNWAVEKGATFYTHWFQPLTGLTAEKHDAFLSLVEAGVAIEEFKVSSLIMGEPDASSFPSGGIRSTFEARGYTAWDPTSPPIIIETELGKTLCIPTIFISYDGKALDKKLPLLKSDSAINKSATKLLKLFGNENVKKVYSTCGPEQEFFLVDKKFCAMRQDLLLAGRTVVGASSPKGQQLEDQYFGTIKERVLNFMCDVAEEAYKIGIPVKTRHNEVAPHQYEFAPIFEKTNLAADNNQLLMELMKKVALRHNLVCLINEKPFAGINGSGKHINWSIADDLGNNLLNPGKTPEENLQFLTILVAVLRAVHKYSDLLRASVAVAGNEHRLGANEAPPAIISVYLGSQLEKILDAIENESKFESSDKNIIDFGIGNLPSIIRDNTDRNRTSPFAFTGQKFEFRAVGSSQNISTPLTVINTIVAESFDYIVEKIEKSEGSDFNVKVFKALKSVISETKAIRFQGNNYSDEWVAEAVKRGLPNEPSTVRALKSFVSDKSVNVFEKHSVLTSEELHSRFNIWSETYCTILEIEANTMIEMVNSSIIPSGLKYLKLLSNNVLNLTKLNAEHNIDFNQEALTDLKNHLSDVSNKIYYVRKNLKVLENQLEESESMEAYDKGVFFFEKLKPVMEHVRKHCDELELVVPDKDWLLPKYREMLFIS